MRTPGALPEVLRKLLPDRLRAVASSEDLAPGSLLFVQGQRPKKMYFLIRGEVVLARQSEQGDSVVLQRVRLGLVAEASLQSARYHCDAQAVAAGTAIAIPINLLKAEIAGDAAFAMRWIEMLSVEVRRLRAQCERLSLKTVRERLIHLIQTESVAGQLSIESGLKSLAAELAVTHEALYRAVAALERAGLIERDANFIRIRNE